MNTEYDSLILTKYKIVYNPDELDKENGITPEIRKLLEVTLKNVLKKKKNADISIEKLIKKYPNIPQFKNYLSTYYSYIGKLEKAFILNKEIVKEHPDYFFGKINLAMEYLKNKEFEKIPAILGETMEIKSLYPERYVFHIEEVMSFFQIAVYYFIETGNIEAAEMRYKIMTDLDKDNVKTTKAAEAIALYNVKKEFEKFRLKGKSRRTPEFISNPKYKQSISEPEFINPEIKLLYKYGFQIDFNVLMNLLELPRESLVEDLKTVIADSISRYNYFKKETDWEFNTHSFVFHALFILSELKAYEALDAVLDLLRQNEKLLDYWLSDGLTEDVWKIIFTLGQDRLDILRDFILEEGNDTYARTAISQAVTQIALHFPERREEVIQWYYIVLNYFLEHKESDGIIDTSLIGLMVCDLLELKAFELEETIVKIYQYGLADTECSGFLFEVLEDLYSKSNYANIVKLPAIQERYKELARWERSIEKNSKAVLKEEKNEINYHALPEIFKKTGRNDKCPCGSGQKFKKCHGKNFI